jgi:hypothetical protein
LHHALDLDLADLQVLCDPGAFERGSFVHHVGCPKPAGPKA